MSESKPLYLKEKDGPRGKFYSKNMGDQENRNYLNGNLNQDGTLTVSFNGETVTAEPRKNQYGTYYVVKIMDSTYFANAGDGQYGKYIRLKEAPPMEAKVPEGGAPEAPATYGTR